MYTPKLLPKLPRLICPGLNLIVNRGFIKTTACKDVPNSTTGFCEAHKHIHTLLCLLEDIHFPALRVNDCLLIPAGLPIWEEYLLTVPAPGQYGVMFTPEQIARWKQEKRPTRYDQIVSAIDGYKSLYSSQRAA